MGWCLGIYTCVGICGRVMHRNFGHIFIPGREEHECGCFLCADSSRVDGGSCFLEHGVFMVNGMAGGEPRKSGGEGIGVCPKHFVPWVLTPLMVEFGVVVKEGCHFF